MNVQVIGLPELEARLNRVVAALGSLLPEFTAVGEELTAFYSTAPFASQGTVYGSQWEPLQPAYAKYKERKYPGKPILVRTGHMMDSFRSAPTPVSVTISNTADYFAKHQLGQGVPQRVMMLLDEQTKKMVIDKMRLMLKSRIDTAWKAA